MTVTATQDQNSTLAPAPVLYFSLELGWTTWKLALTIGLGQKPRLRTLRARNLDGLLAEDQGGGDKGTYVVIIAIGDL